PRNTVAYLDNQGFQIGGWFQWHPEMVLIPEQLMLNSLAIHSSGHVFQFRDRERKPDLESAVLKLGQQESRSIGLTVIADRNLNECSFDDCRNGSNSRQLPEADLQGIIHAGAALDQAGQGILAGHDLGRHFLPKSLIYDRKDSRLGPESHLVFRPSCLRDFDKGNVNGL